MKQNKADKINSVFEAGGGLFVILSIIQVICDKSVAGVSPYHVAFFATWGYWHLYYYKIIKQRWTLYSSCLITAANTVWLVLLIYYIMTGG